MSETKKSILITGANGFVGSRLSRMFAENGYQVVAGVRKTADLSLLADIPVAYRYGDVTQPNTLPQMVTGVDYVIHNAGVVKAKTRQGFFDVNETGTRNLFEAIISHNPNVKRVIYVSSFGVNGPSAPGRPCEENDEPHPITDYSSSKLAGEKVAFSYADRIDVVSLRPTAVYGPGDREMFSFFQTVDCRFRPYIGSTKRKIQLIHVDDLCCAVMMALEGNPKRGEAYFIAENKAYTLKELVGYLVKAGGKSAFPLYVPGPVFKLIGVISGGVMKLLDKVPMLTLNKAGELLATWEVSTEKAKRDFGFVSQIPFPEGAKATFRWYRERGWL